MVNLYVWGEEVVCTVQYVWRHVRGVRLGFCVVICQLPGTDLARLGREEGAGEAERGRRPAQQAVPEPTDGRSARQILDLNQAFQKITDVRVRRQVVQLVKALSRA